MVNVLTNKRTISGQKPLQAIQRFIINSVEDEDIIKI